MWIYWCWTQFVLSDFGPNVNRMNLYIYLISYRSLSAQIHYVLLLILWSFSTVFCARAIGSTYYVQSILCATISVDSPRFRHDYPRTKIARTKFCAYEWLRARLATRKLGCAQLVVVHIYVYIYIYNIHWWLQWRQVGALSPTSSECKFRPFSTVASIDERNHTGFVRVALQRYIVKLKSSEQLEVKYIYICIYYINFIKWHIYIYIYIHMCIA